MSDRKPEARWLVVVDQDTGETYGEAIGRDRQDVIEQLRAVAEVYGVPLERLDVLPPLD